MTSINKTIMGTLKHWYVPFIIGLVFIALGIYIFTVPLETYLTLTYIFSFSFIFSGLSDTVFSIQNHKNLNGWGWYLINGVLSLAMGFFLIYYPETSSLALALMVGFTLLARSFMLLGYSFDLRDFKVQGWGYLTTLSVLGILFSILLLSNPLIAGLSLVTLTSLSFIFVGIASIALSFKLRKLKEMAGKISKELKDKLNHLQAELEQQIGRK